MRGDDTATDDERALRSLEDVVRRPDLTLVEVVVQDEYTHDVVVQTAPDGARFLVFDTT